MPTTVVRYTTHPDRGEANAALVEAVFAELAVEHPEGLRYITFRLEDGDTFVHVAMVDSEDGTNPLTRVAAFGEFQAGIPERFEAPPTVMGATIVGSYGFADLA